MSFQKLFNGARALKEKLLKGETLTPFAKPESVRSLKSQSLVVYTEFAFVTESDLAMLVDMSSKSLKLPKPIRLTIEDGSKLNGWALSLRGLTTEQQSGLRKFRLEHRATTEFSEQLLQSCLQIRKGQGVDHWTHVCAKVNEARPSAARTSGRPHLLLLENLQQKADEIMEAWVGLSGTNLMQQLWGNIVLYNYIA